MPVGRAMEMPTVTATKMPGIVPERVGLRWAMCKSINKPSITKSQILHRDLRRRACEILVLGFACGKQSDQGQSGCGRKVVTDGLQAVAVRQPGGDVGRQRGTEDACEVEGQRASRVAHGCRKQLRQDGAERPIREAH